MPGLLMQGGEQAREQVRLPEVWGGGEGLTQPDETGSWGRKHLALHVGIIDIQTLYKQVESDCG